MSIHLTTHTRDPVVRHVSLLRSRPGTSASASSMSTISRATTTTEDWAARRARLRRLIPPPPPPPPPRASSRAVVSRPPTAVVTRRGLHVARQPAPSSSFAASMVVPYTTEFHRSTAFTSSFTTLYHDTSMEGAAIHDQRQQRHAALQETRLQRCQRECLQLRGLAIKYKNRAEQLRKRLRQDRQCQYACLTSAVRRLQAVFRRKQLLKKRREEEARAAQEAAELVQAWGRRAMALVAARRKIMQTKRAIQCRAAGKVISQFLSARWQIKQAKKERQRLLDERRQRKADARVRVALYGQAWFRGWQVRRRRAEERRQHEEAARKAAADEEERRRGRRKKGQLHSKPFR